MTHNEWFKKEEKKPICVGTGLVALDVIIKDSNNPEAEILAGGSCGNVLTVLSYLNWESYPIAYLRDDSAAEKLLNDLEKWKVKTNFVYRSESGNTPIIIEKFGTNNKGKPWHRFEWKCPYCKLRFPKYKSIPLSEVRKISEEIPVSKVFYFDRARKSTLELATKSKKDGALIVFEPSGITNEKVFLKCIEIADIVKYSRERVGHFKAILEDKNIPLEIETLDEEGLVYRFNGYKNLKGEWKRIQAYPVKKVKDTTGAGDWCTAGIVHILGKKGREGFLNADEKKIQGALKFGQLLSAFKCYYEGARGCMYNVSEQDFKTIINRISEGTDPLDLIENSKRIAESIYTISACPFCDKQFITNE